MMSTKVRLRRRFLSSRRYACAVSNTYLDGVKPAQRAAVEQDWTVRLMLGGAGTGKTKAFNARMCIDG